MAGRKTGLARQIAATFVSKILGTLLGLLASAVVARSLGPEGRGSLITAMTLAGIGTGFASLGLQSSNTYFISRDRFLLAPILANSMFASILFGTIAIIALGLFAITSGLLQTVGRALVFVALLSVPVGLASMLLVNLLVARAQISVFNTLEIGSKSALVALTLGAIWLLPTDPLAVAGVTLLVSIGSAAWAWFALGGNCSTWRACRPRLLVDHMPYAFRSYLSSLFSFLLLKFDIIMVQHYAGNAEVGQYSIAVAMVDLIYILPMTAGMLLFPSLTTVTDERARRASTTRMLFAIGGLMIVLALCSAALAGPAIRLIFGADFQSAAPMFHILVGAIVAYGLSSILSNHLAAEGQPWSVVWVWAVALLMNVSLNVFWIPSGGGKGAAWASAVAYSFALMLLCLIVFQPASASRRLLRGIGSSKLPR